MSNYARHKHGLTIGSGNNFFYRDENDEYRDFPAVVSLDPYYFDRHTTLHVGIRTPAEQLIFYEDGIEEPKEYKGEKWVEKRTMYRLKSWWVNWLDQNCPGWGYPPMKNADRVPTLFFARRKDALTFVRYIEQTLAGMRIGLN